MALNLVRNSRVFFTTNVDTTGKVNPSSTTAFSSSNTFELQVLDGFTFSQNVNAETVTINEAGSAPVRGQRSFNTSLAPVDFSFSTYIRPKKVTGTPNKITAEESVLWNALLSSNAIGTPTSLTSVTGVTVSAAGLVTIAGTAITGTLPTIGDKIVLSGIATTTPANGEKFINSVGEVKTSAVTGVTVQLYSYPTAAVTATTLATSGTVKYSKFAWNESNGSYSQANTGLSDTHQLQKFGMLFLVDSVLYAVDNCALAQVTVDFGLDTIATAQWSGQATALRQFGTGIGINAAGNAFTGGTGTNVGTGGFHVKVTDANYITNKLSTASLKAVKALGTSIAAGDTYPVAITGGSFTINNNITYITPANLGIVNKPETYYTGTRAISGNLTAYLRTGGTKDLGELLSDMLTEVGSTIEPAFAVSIEIGGSTNTVKVELDMPAATIGIPTVDVQQVVSTNITFTAQGYDQAANVFDLAIPSDFSVRYYS